MRTVTFPSVSPVLKKGDIFTMHQPVYRKWWQFWKPKVVGHKLQKFVIVESYTT